MTKEITRQYPSGYAMLGILLVLQIVSIAAVVLMPPVIKVVAALVAIVVFICWFGFFLINPNEGKVLQLFGDYVGTCRDPGLRWANPFYSKHTVSLRVRNFESSKLKVNDSHGNPIEIAAVVVWRVVDTAEAMFQVDDYENFVSIQSEAAVRNLATTYPYDQHEDGETALRSHAVQIADEMRKEIQDRLETAGVEVIEARISHLAYAPEIASAMLRRQQATAVIAARTKVVEGAVTMVQMALEQLRKQGVVDLDEERRAAMVSNLLVVLCSEHNTQPVVNTGTLYS
ncbi:SPFH domain-containing protein [Permianibacter aggregans]|uniref:Regulator of protease activity HflC (Stomatin/prohibitin superfamily) n=1 Tax=Permianibacter aggregans TaxID=1510150 RepID=A0A4R6UIA5_9GAMM|nr:SPFH domain-containing protein [Permianibacter aggregans]QGX41185.1 SPFH domain-containing protein [Permianibacter aggregans]TDQ45786.1 regulator of protease activity HflC (stomatin/prohibitin superfamily) [Permianibacter aggregans]